MEKSQTVEDTYLKNPLSRQIWNEIVASLEEYTDDNIVAKFFSPEPLVLQCRIMAAALTAALYDDEITQEELLDTPAYHILFTATIWGVQTYSKEWLFVQNHTTFVLAKNTQEELAETRSDVLKQLTEKIIISDAAQDVLQAYYAKFILNGSEEEYAIRNKKFNKEQFNNTLKTALYWGYLFGKATIATKD